MGASRVFKFGDATAPGFPADYEIVRRAVLQVTDIKTNRNKYYAIELHSAVGKNSFRVFTHYGRTDDLENNPNAGQKECRYFANAASAQYEYQSIYAEKTSHTKGYREVSLASSKIGSPRARGTSAGEVDAKTVARIEAANDNATSVKAPAASSLDAGVQRLVRYLYAEATNALTTTVAAKITARGIETPLGVLTIGQIEKGEAILHELYDAFKNSKKSRDRLVDLSGEFYTAVPHRIGRTRGDVQSAVIDSMADFEQKQETLQLMKDMLRVNGERGGVLFHDDVDAKYEALSCGVRALTRGSDEFRAIERQVLDSQVRSHKIQVRNVFTVRRGGEWDGFESGVGNQRLLFHGSRVKNWVGILSRGLVLPKIAVSMGVSRTDAGWLGNGIYFGDAACTSAFYTSAGREGTRFMAVARVGLGRAKDFTKITYGLSAPPAGFDSCHGVRARSGVHSEFADDEYVVYEQRKQRLEYLVEFAA